MKKKLILGLAIALCSAMPFIAATSRAKHDVVLLNIGWGYPMLWSSSSSSNAPVFPSWNWTNNTGVTVADTIAQLLDEGFEQKADVTRGTEYGNATLQFVRTR